MSHLDSHTLTGASWVYGVWGIENVASGGLESASCVIRGMDSSAGGQVTLTFAGEASPVATDSYVCLEILIACFNQRCFQSAAERQNASLEFWQEILVSASSVASILENLDRFPRTNSVKSQSQTSLV